MSEENREQEQNQKRSKRCCQTVGCGREASFNFEQSSERIYCTKHKQDGMVNVKNKNSLCRADGCKSRPSYNVEGSARPLFCVTHKTDDMVDVVTFRCIADGCSSQPSFNEQGKTKAIYCGTHKRNGMVDVRSAKCQEKDCVRRPSFNFEGSTERAFCGRHKRDRMVDVAHERCVQYEICYTRANTKYDGYCFRCFQQRFPDHPMMRNYKTKEKSVVDAIKEAFPETRIVEDKRVAGGCSRKRPDVLMDCGTHWTVVEVDENQHATYDCVCENRRLMEIFTDLGSCKSELSSSSSSYSASSSSSETSTMPLVVVRFNPDGYIRRDATKQPTPWLVGRGGVLEVRAKWRDAWTSRIRALLDTVRYWQSHCPSRELEVVSLFFDNFD